MEEVENTGQIITLDGKGEIISIGVGDSGINTLYYFFNEIAQEHKIIKGEDEEEPIDKDIIEMPNIFFRDKKKLRAVLVDTGSKSKILDSEVGKLIDKGNIIHSKGKTERLWGLQNSEEGKSLINSTLEAIRKEAEKCSSIGGFQIFHNMGGGIGSAVTCKILQNMIEEFPKNCKITHSLIPVFKDNQYDETINCVFTLNELIEKVDVCNVIKSESVTKYCKYNKIKVETGKFNVENQIVGKMVADLTSSMRFKGLEYFSFDKLGKYMCPYPRVKFVSPSIVNPSDENVEKVLLYKLFNDNSCLGLQKNNAGKFISNYAVFRGEFELKLLEDAIVSNYYKAKNCYSTDWSGNNFYWNNVKVEGISGESAVKITNNSNFKDILSYITSTVDNASAAYDEEGVETRVKNSIFEKLEKLGVESGEFSEARENLAALLKDYEEIEAETVEYNEEN